MSINRFFFTFSLHFYRTVSGSIMQTLKSMFKSCCIVFMRLDRGKIILNKTGQVTSSSKKAPGKRHLHNGKTYPRCNSSPDIMEPFFQSRFSKSKVRCRYSSTRDRMTSEYHTSHDVRVARALARDGIKFLLFGAWYMWRTGLLMAAQKIRFQSVFRDICLFAGFDNNNVQLNYGYEYLPHSMRHLFQIMIRSITHVVPKRHLAQLHHSVSF